MLLTVALGRHCGGDFDVAGLAAKAVRLCPGGDFTGEQYRHGYALLRLLAAGLAADRFGASVTFIVGSLLLARAQAGRFTIWPGVILKCCSIRGRAVRWRGGGGALCDGSGLPARSPLHRDLILIQCFICHLRWTDADCGYGIDGRVAPGYVLALSLMGLVLGIWLRQMGRMSCPRGGHDRGISVFTNR